MKGCSRAPAPPIGQLMPRRPGSAVAVCGTRSRRVASAFGVERRDAQHGVEGVAATGGQRLRLRLLDDARLHPARGGMGGGTDQHPPLPRIAACRAGWESGIRPATAGTGRHRSPLRQSRSAAPKRSRHCRATQQAREAQRGRHNARAASAAAHYRAAEAALTRLDLGDGRPGRT